MRRRKLRNDFGNLSYRYETLSRHDKKMSKEKYDNQSITAYLLGALPEDETERFDELSFTDDEFAGALDAAEKDLIDAYARGELTGDALKKFESHYLASPLRREKVKFAGAFQIFAERKTAETMDEKLVENPAPEKSPAGFFSVFNNLTKNNLLQFGFASATLLILILGGFWLFGNRRDEPKIEIAAQNSPAPVEPKQIESPNLENANVEKEIASTGNENNSTQKPEKEESNKNVAVNQNAQTRKPPKITVASFVLTPSLRGANQVPNFSISKETVWVAVRLNLESDDYTTYRVRLADESGSGNIWSSGALRAQGKDGNKTLNVQFPAKLLKSQIYTLVVSGVKNGEAEILTNYAFRAVIK